MKKSIIAASAVLFALSAMAASNTIRVLPLGDSITYGQGWDPYGGYRAVLREALEADGYSIDYVGTQTANAGTLAVSGDIQHEGHPGWKIHEIEANIALWSTQFDAPHAILLKIGTNDLGYDFPNAISRYRILLDTLQRIYPSTHIFVATIIRSIKTENDELIETVFNGPLRTLVAQRAAKGCKLHLVDMYPLLEFGTDKDFADDRHPNEAGYRKMAAAWKKAFEAVFTSPTAAMPDVKAVVSPSELRHVAGIENNAKEAKGWTKVYEIDLPEKIDLSASEPEWTLDNHRKIGAFSRIGYYLELEGPRIPLRYVWVAMDAFTDDPKKIAFPTVGSGAFFHTRVTGLSVCSNVSTVKRGKRGSGNIEFWPWNYYKSRKLGIDGASDDAYDVDDTCNMEGNFGSMQIHDSAAASPVLCINGWGGINALNVYDIGIGPRPGSGDTDWTHAHTSGEWTTRRHLEIYVLEKAKSRRRGK